MTIEYTIVTAVVAALYLILKKYFPDLPIPVEVFQILVGYCLIKIGVVIVGVPAEAVRKALAGKRKLYL